MGKEFELKFAATAESQAAVRASFDVRWITYQMETTYYDTPSHDCAARRWTLRRRMENGTPICTVKTPAPGGARGEWETECGDIREAIPTLCKLGGPEALAQIAEQGLLAVCGARFTRQAGTLALGESVVEIALDNGVLLGGGNAIPLCEIEVELKAGSEEDALAFAKALSARFGLKSEPLSKYRRAALLAEE